MYREHLHVSIESDRNCLLLRPLKTYGPFPQIPKTLEGPQSKEAGIYVTYFKINCAMGVECRDKVSALFHKKDYRIIGRRLKFIQLIRLS